MTCWHLTCPVSRTQEFGYIAPRLLLTTQQRVRSAFARDAVSLMKTRNDGMECRPSSLLPRPHTALRHTEQICSRARLSLPECFRRPAFGPVCSCLETHRDVRATAVKCLCWSDLKGLKCTDPNLRPAWGARGESQEQIYRHNIHPVVAELFQSGPKCGTNTSDRRFLPQRHTAG